MRMVVAYHSILCYFSLCPSFDAPIQCCSRHLQSNEEGEGAVVQSLCALVLLEGSSPRQVFTRFLLARKVGKGEGRRSGREEDRGEWVGERRRRLY